jgi:MFS transporter, UMF1 family
MRPGRARHKANLRAAFAFAADPAGAKRGGISMSEPFPPVRRREIFGWCCFDFANSAFTTVIITVVFSLYFRKTVAGDDPQALAWWGTTLAGSQLAAIILGPLLGAMADALARKKIFLLCAAAVCAGATAGLAFVGPGEVWLALGLVAVANLAFSLSENFCSAFLPEISTPENAGRISGYGWSFGYFGGLLSLVLALVMLKAWGWPVQAAFVMTALFFVAASLPTLLLLRERARPRPVAAGESLLGRAFGQLRVMLRELPRHRTLAVFFVAMTIYLSGLLAVVAFAGNFAEREIGMSEADVIKLFIVLQVAGVAGAAGFGFLQDRWGAKTVLVLALLMWVVVGIWAVFCRRVGEFYLLGALAGVAMGGLQAAGRAVVATLTPAGRSGEFFGYWGFFGKLAGVVGPLVFGWVAARADMRVAIGANTTFFVIGLLVLLTLRFGPVKDTAVR